ncbi:hypothetical protein [Kingella oralis]|uniref:hypothetical protein n=1 Tax=Kingella oralis TaxID=505 RepID=UPI002D7F33F4|nr:hypothetical protein [Kingella oralis]
MPDLQQQFLQSFLNIQQDSRLRGNDGGWVYLLCGKGFRLPCIFVKGSLKIGA